MPFGKKRRKRFLFLSSFISFFFFATILLSWQKKKKLGSFPFIVHLVFFSPYFYYLMGKNDIRFLSSSSCFISTLYYYLWEKNKINILFLSSSTCFFPHVFTMLWEKQEKKFIFFFFSSSIFSIPLVFFPYFYYLMGKKLTFFSFRHLLGKRQKSTFFFFRCLLGERKKIEISRSSPIGKKINILFLSLPFEKKKMKFYRSSPFGKKRQKIKFFSFRCLLVEKRFKFYIRRLLGKKK